MAWTFLTIAGILEIVWAIAMKSSHGFTRLWPSVLTIGTAYLSFYFLSRAVATLPIGTAYAVWTGIGAVGTAILGVILFREPATLVRALCILLIVAGILGLKMSAATPVLPGP
jgi:quaternary ammonium compound-resistance protein SugE